MRYLTIPLGALGVLAAGLSLYAAPRSNDLGALGQDSGFAVMVCVAAMFGLVALAFFAAATVDVLEDSHPRPL